MMPPGAQTVTLRNYTTSGRDRFNNPIRVAVDTVFKSCAMQPVSVTETVTLTDIETELWKCFLPPTSDALAANTNSEIIYNGLTFQVLGSRPGVDLMGSADHVALDLKKQIA